MPPEAYLFRKLALQELSLYDQDDGELRQLFGLTPDPEKTTRAKNLMDMAIQLESSEEFFQALELIPIEKGPQIVENARLFARAIATMAHLPHTGRGLAQFRRNPIVDVSLL